MCESLHNPILIREARTHARGPKTCAYSQAIPGANFCRAGPAPGWDGNGRERQLTWHASNDVAVVGTWLAVRYKITHKWCRLGQSTSSLLLACQFERICRWVGLPKTNKSME
jgi:hypothetical protein